MIVNNTTNVVTHDNTFTLTNLGAVRGRFTDTIVNSSTAKQIDGIELPCLFNPSLFTYVEGVFELTEYGVEKIQKSLIKRVDSISSKIEYGNIELNGSIINTSSPSQIRINGAYSAILIDPSKVIDFKNSDGTWVRLNATEITAIADAVASHVQSCFSNEKTLYDLIMSKDTYVDLMSIDLMSGWADVVNNPFDRKSIKP